MPAAARPALWLPSAPEWGPAGPRSPARARLSPPRRRCRLVRVVGLGHDDTDCDDRRRHDRRRGLSRSMVAKRPSCTSHSFSDRDQQPRRDAATAFRDGPGQRGACRARQQVISGAERVLAAPVASRERQQDLTASDRWQSDTPERQHELEAQRRPRPSQTHAGPRPCSPLTRGPAPRSGRRRIHGAPAAHDPPGRACPTPQPTRPSPRAPTSAPRARPTSCSPRADAGVGATDSP